MDWPQDEILGAGKKHGGGCLRIGYEEMRIDEEADLCNPIVSDVSYSVSLS